MLEWSESDEGLRLRMGLEGIAANAAVTTIINLRRADERLDGLHGQGAAYRAAARGLQALEEAPGQLLEEIASELGQWI
jgi:hypothetical protein